jgi:protein fuzzy
VHLQFDFIPSYRLSNEGAALNSRLHEFSEQITSPFCCLMMRHRIAGATEAFWDLHVKDRKLLVYFLNISSTLEKDSPVYLPMRSPHVNCLKPRIEIFGFIDLSLF